jgi:hypothetical protein
MAAIRFFTDEDIYAAVAGPSPLLRIIPRILLGSQGAATAGQYVPFVWQHRDMSSLRRLHCPTGPGRADEIAQKVPGTGLASILR